MHEVSNYEKCGRSACRTFSRLLNALIKERITEVELKLPRNLKCLFSLNYNFLKLLFKADQQTAHDEVMKLFIPSSVCLIAVINNCALVHSSQVLRGLYMKS